MSHLSRRTVGFLLGGVLVIAAIAATIILSGSEDLGVVLSDIGEAGIVSACAVVILLASRRFTGALQRNWTLVGVGVAAFAIGDIVWTYIEVFQGREVPYPGLPDVFYLSEYLFLGAGIALAGLAYRAVLPVRRSAAVGAGVTAVLAVALWFGFISPQVVKGDWNPESLLSAAYPLADVVLLLGPAIFILLMVRKLGGGRLGWPWWAVAIGAIILAVSDSVYSYLTAIDAYQSGMTVDYGWMLAHVALATGALIAADLAHPLSSRTPAEKPAGQRVA